MNNNLKFTLRFDAETRQFVGQVRGADQAVDALGNQSSATGRQMQKMARQSDVMERQMLGLRSQLLGAAAGFSAVAVAAQATERLGAYQDLRTQITALVGGQQEWLQTEKYLIEVSKDHNKALIGMAGNYARVASIEDAGMITRQQTLAIFEGMSNAAATYGATNDQLGQSMFGLQQAMSSQIVRAEELNQTTEPLPGLLTRMDRAAGLAAGGFRQMVNAGEVTSSFFAETLVKALATYDGAAAKTSGNVRALYADLSTAYTEAVVAFETPISDSFSPVILTMTQGLEVLADNAELVSTAVGLTLTLALARGTAAIVNMTVAKTRDMMVDRARNVQLVQQTQATIAVTSAEIAHWEALQVSNAYIFAATGGEQALTAARARLTAATNTLSAAQAAASITGRTLSASMAMLGGPAGIVMLAASAIGYFALTASNAQEPTASLENEVKRLAGSYSDLNAEQRNIRISQLGVEASEVRTQLMHTRRQVDQLAESMKYADAATRGPAYSKMEQLAQDAEELEQKLVTISAKQQAIFNDGLPKKWKLLEPPKKNPAEDQAKKQLALMQRQLSLYGQKNEAAKISYELEHGALKTINDDLKQQLLLEAKKLDNKAAEVEAQQRLKTLNKDGQEQLGQLRQQIALHGITDEAARLRYDIEHGALKGINEELAKNLLLEAEKLDKLSDSDTGGSGAIDSFYAESDALNNAWLMRLAIMADRENEAKIREEYAYNDRLGRLSGSFQKAYAQAQENHQLQDELEREYFANREILRAEHEANLTDINRNAEDERQAYQAQIAESTLSFTQQQLSITTNFLKQAGEEQSGFYRVLFAAQKLAAIPSMIIATEEAATKALSFGPPPVGMALSGAVRTMGYASVGIAAGQALAGQAHDGIWRVPAANEGTWMLKDNEMVLNNQQADDFRWMVGMMQQMKIMQSQQYAQQQAYQGGGSPNINVAAAPVHVAVLDNQEQLTAYLRSDAGEQAIVKVVQRNKANL
ncbi:tape measure protein [Photobacterium sanguinicancri]|uniref:tape measure protein n=1 Tax=Photobacterium sanguinicancri TaxID=875932 RepID=UPI0026E261C4|nr:tape measure protein [Photobacterium sanguinicancri]MDO6497323.1 tape measure protein [Photobacterium sanguinicancri]